MVTWPNNHVQARSDFAVNLLRPTMESCELGKYPIFAATCNRLAHCVFTTDCDQLKWHLDRTNVRTLDRTITSLTGFSHCIRTKETGRSSKSAQMEITSVLSGCLREQSLQICQKRNCKTQNSIKIFKYSLNYANFHLCAIFCSFSQFND